MISKNYFGGMNRSGFLAILMFLMGCNFVTPEIKQTSNVKMEYCKKLLLGEIDSLGIVNGEIEIFHGESEILTVVESPSDNIEGKSQNLSVMINEPEKSSNNGVGVNIYTVVKYDEKNVVIGYSHIENNSVDFLSVEIDTGSFILKLEN